VKAVVRFRSSSSFILRNVILPRYAPHLADALLITVELATRELLDAFQSLCLALPQHRFVRPSGIRILSRVYYLITVHSIFVSTSRFCRTPARSTSTISTSSAW
jgi:hypothetical protein